MPSGATQERRVMVERSDRMWSTGEGNGKPLQYSCLEWTEWPGRLQSMGSQKSQTRLNRFSKHTHTITSTQPWFFYCTQLFEYKNEEQRSVLKLSWKERTFQGKHQCQHLKNFTKVFLNYSVWEDLCLLGKKYVSLVHAPDTQGCHQIPPYPWHSATSGSSGGGLSSDFFQPMIYLFTAPCLW